MTHPITRPTIRLLRLAAALALVGAAASPAAAQLDPLMAIKRVPPNVIVVFDTSFRMLDDGSGNYYDPGNYQRNDDTTVASALGVPATVSEYRRRLVTLKMEDVQDVTHKYKVRAIQPAWGTRDAAGRDHFWDNTRYETARRGLQEAFDRNRARNFRWGLLKLRQNAAQWRVATSGCDKPVRWATEALDGQPVIPQPVTASGAVAGDAAANCNAGGPGFYGVWAPTTVGANAAVATAQGFLVTPGAAGSLESFYNYVRPRNLITESPLVPAGLDTAAGEDRPLNNALIDAKAAVIAAATGDGEYPSRNTVVILIAGGRDYGATDPAIKAAEFRSIVAGGVTRRAPIFVIGVRPKGDDVVQLARIASASGGRYFGASNWMDVMRGVNIAVQAGFSRQGDFNLARNSEFLNVSPVIGTVNLEDAVAANLTTLPNTVVSTPQGVHIPQRNNMMISSGFALGQHLSHSLSPGFEGRLRAFRVYKPITDTTKPSGYTFTKDGTALWPDRDGRPALAGQARTPADPARRNIFTYIPGTGMVSFSSDSAETLRPYLALENPNVAVGFTPSALIEYVRALPLGAIISSTPAIMDPPSLDPPPDDDYGRTDSVGTYAGRHKDRRSIIWVGANDGMLHAIDARTGYEVWAFIPFNLLPKLQMLYGGQAVDEFTYFVDQSPKIAEVKLNGEWRSMLIIGQGWGGTFFQTFDVTEAGMGGPLPNSDDVDGVLASFSSGTRVQFKWAFPEYDSFDPTIYDRVPVSDGTPGRYLSVFGELRPDATGAEKTVGYTWSDPAVGPLDLARSVNVAIVGSGFYPGALEDRDAIPSRRGVGAGHAFYLLNMETGQPLGSGSGLCSGTGCIDVGDVTSGGNARKNALQADPTVTGDPGAYVARRAYLGDVDGNYWRFDFTAAGAITKTLLYAAGKPIYASSALMWVGNTQLYVFFATGSDILPVYPATTGGGGTFSLLGVKDTGAGTKTFEVSLEAVSAISDVIPVGERPSTSPSVAGDIVFFTTTKEGAAASTEPTFKLYGLTYTGTDAYLPPGVAPADKKKGGPAAAPTAIKTGTGRATAPFIVDQHLYFATTDASGASIEAFGDPNDFNNGVGQVGVRILSWREIRR